ncbi:hypothetical protein [Bradyrhizobium paxllaeri]|uniref:hypothetical protein n=1 Tax=Bradyrhizobium paxllaeri TaxID=190148 RepID=UPI00082826E6|nr:hypothetical protein [Bradyrhizobium paxllaeri]
MKLDVVALLNSDTWAMADGWAAKAAVTLWCRAWHQVPAGSLPNDAVALRSLANIPDFDSVREMALRGFIECSDGRLYHPTICKAVKESLKALRQRKNAANKRWENKKKLNAGADAPAKRSQSGSQSGCNAREKEREKKDSSFPNGKAPGGAEPGLFAVQGAPSAKPPPADPPTPDAELYRRGREVLGKNCGGLITDLKKHHGGNVALARATIEHASTKADPREYVGAVIRGRGRQTSGELWDTGI